MLHICFSSRNTSIDTGALLPVLVLTHKDRGGSLRYLLSVTFQLNDASRVLPRPLLGLPINCVVCRQVFALKPQLLLPPFIPLSPLFFLPSVHSRAPFLNQFLSALILIQIVWVLCQKSPSCGTRCHSPRYSHFSTKTLSLFLLCSHHTAPLWVSLAYRRLLGSSIFLAVAP